MDGAEKTRIKRGFEAFIAKYELSGCAQFYDFIGAMITTHASKNSDYSSNPEYSGLDNFIKVAAKQGISVRQVFRTLQGVKQERYASLVQSGKPAANEPVDDTLLDMAVYAGLEAAFIAKYGNLIDRPLVGIPNVVDEQNLLAFFPRDIDS